jgi:hypothetical protein
VRIPPLFPQHAQQACKNVNWIVETPSWLVLMCPIGLDIMAVTASA